MLVLHVDQLIFKSVCAGFAAPTVPGAPPPNLRRQTTTGPLKSIKAKPIHDQHARAFNGLLKVIRC